ncbi:MAG: hypothetical protein ACXVA9_03540 [Bdellovibrionales bacterium]
MRFFGDVLRARATTIVMLMFFSGAVAAEIDFNISGAVRSYPLSGILEGDLGYGLLLWGQHGSGPMYGYIRPHVGAATAGYYNSAIASLDLYPISFFGFRAGGEAIENDKNYTAYDCDRYQCKGRSYRTFAQGELTVGHGPIFVQLREKREHWTLGNPNSGEFMETSSGLSLSGQGDSQTVYRAVAGYKINPTWTVMGVYMYSQSDNTREISRFPYAALRYVTGPCSVGVGAGVYSSTIKPEGGSALAYFGWNIKPSLALQ